MAALSGTLVFFTHQAKMDEILPSLQARFPADTPVAIVCDVSYPTELLIRGTLGEIRTGYWRSEADAVVPVLRWRWVEAERLLPAALIRRCADSTGLIGVRAVRADRRPMALRILARCVCERSARRGAQS